MQIHNLIGKWHNRVFCHHNLGLLRDIIELRDDSIGHHISFFITEFITVVVEIFCGQEYRSWPKLTYLCVTSGTRSIYVCISKFSQINNRRQVSNFHVPFFLSTYYCYTQKTATHVCLWPTRCLLTYRVCGVSNKPIINNYC